MIRKIKDILLFNYSSSSNMMEVRHQVMDDNRKLCIVWAAVHGLFLIYCLIMTAVNPDYLRCRAIYAISLAVCIICLFLSVYLAPKHNGLIGAIAFILDETLLLSGVLIAQHLAPQTITIFASVLIVPVVFITDTFSVALMLLVNLIVFTQVGARTMEHETYKWVLTNLCIFSALGGVIGHFVNKTRFERYLFAESKAELADTQARYAHYDQLTDLQNRRAYEETIEELAKDLPSGCCVIAVDVNDLKKTNDNLGHHVGDELLIGTARCLCRSFVETDRIYRTGGDEFAVIILDEGYDVDAALGRLNRYSADWKGDQIHGFTVSTGVASAKEFDSIDAILRAADQRMYDFKREYYEKSGRDRRRR